MVMEDGCRGRVPGTGELAAFEITKPVPVGSCRVLHEPVINELEQLAS